MTAASLHVDFDPHQQELGVHVYTTPVDYSYTKHYPALNLKRTHSVGLQMSS